MGSQGGDVLVFPVREDDSGDDANLVALVEALLFAVGEPVTTRALTTAIEIADDFAVEKALATLGRQLATHRRGIELIRVAGGWQLRTDARFSDVVLRLLGTRPAKLSRAALEVLSIVAYRQPATRADVEAIRGVDSGGVIKTLIDRSLVRVAGRRAEPGRPLEYRTTKGFLEMFGLARLEELPTLEERKELDEGE